MSTTKKEVGGEEYSRGGHAQGSLGRHACALSRYRDWSRAKPLPHAVSQRRRFFGDGEAHRQARVGVWRLDVRNGRAVAVRRALPVPHNPARLLTHALPPVLTPSMLSPSPWRFCVAPMMEWTDRHCRSFFRQLSRHARLYTEMITTGALLHGDVARHLGFDPQEQPVALQLGGSERDELSHCARLGAAWGYAEINLNCGCPSPRVQRGAFGACLMAEAKLVADCVKAMQDAVSIPVTVKHRIGIDRNEEYGLVRDFVAHLYDAGCRVFIVHARNAWLYGLSPKENREIPPLRLDLVHRLQKDFGDATLVAPFEVDDQHASSSKYP